MPAGLVARNALTATLDRGARADVTLVCAPAGFGKTTLLSLWANDPDARGGCPVAWLSLDRHDNDTFRLWSGILTALQAYPGADADRLAGLSPPREMEPGFLAAFIDAIEAGATTIWLVLDDAHHVRDAAAGESLQMLLERLPQRLKLVLAYRADPSLPALRKLRLAGRLHEIRSTPLAFDRDEAAGLLATHGVRLSDPALDLLLGRTEGWPAALRLAGLSLAERADPAGAVDELVSNDVNVADYLFGEALARQPESVREFMLRTSVCERFTEDLAEALTGQPAAAVLDRLERDNALITRTGAGGRWYRYHSLLRSYALAHLSRRHALAPLHATAAAWFAAHGEIEAALEHAVAAEDAEAVSELLREHGLHLVMTGGGRPLLRLLTARLSRVIERPPVLLVAAAAALDARQLTTADDLLGRLHGAATAGLDGRQRILSAALRVQRATLGGDVAAAAAALAAIYRAPCGDPDLDLLALTYRGTAAYAMGDTGAAEIDLREAAERAEHAHNDYFRMTCLSTLAAVLSVKSDFVTMGRIAAEAIALATRCGWAADPRCAHAYTVAAWSAYARAETAEAGHLARMAMAALGSVSEPMTSLSARCAAVAVAFDAGDQQAALRDWCAIWDHLGETYVHPSIAAFGATIQVRMALAVGEPRLATQAVDRVRGLRAGAAEVNLLQAQIHADRGRPDRARQLLSPVLAGELAQLVITTAINAWLLEAVLAAAGGEPAVSRRAVDRALALAAPRWALRDVLAGGQPVRDLLVRDIGRFGRYEDFVAAAIAGIGPGTGPLPEPLSPRERELLAELPSMRTVDQLAQVLFIAPSTVKTHLRNIYGKLGVSTRRDAVAAARRLGLL